MQYSRTCLGYTRDASLNTTYVNWSDGSQSEFVGTPDEIRNQIVEQAGPAAKTVLDALAIQSITADDPNHDNVGPQFPQGRTYTLDMTGVSLTHTGD